MLVKHTIAIDFLVAVLRHAVKYWGFSYHRHMYIYIYIFVYDLTPVAILAQVTFQLLRLYATVRSGGLSFPATLDDWTQMAVSLPDAIPRGSLLQLSPWMFKTLSERSGQLVLVVPIQLGTYYEQVFGAKCWVRCNLTHEEFAQLDDCSRGGGALSNNPGHYQCSLSQVTMRLCRGLDGDEGVAMRSIVPFLFHSVFYPGNSGSRGWVGYCRDVLFGYSARIGSLNQLVMCSGEMDSTKNFGDCPLMDTSSVLGVTREDHCGNMLSTLQDLGVTDFRSFTQHGKDLALPTSSHSYSWAQLLCTVLSVDEYTNRTRVLGWRNRISGSRWSSHYICQRTLHSRWGSRRWVTIS